MWADQLAGASFLSWTAKPTSDTFSTLPGAWSMPSVPVSACHQVLIVDDNDDVRDAMSAVLQHEGFDVAPAWGVEDALRHLRQGFKPCVILLDLHMPGMDGWAFLDRIRIEPHLHETPVIIVSGDIEQEAAARRLGV